MLATAPVFSMGANYFLLRSRTAILRECLKGLFAVYQAAGADAQFVTVPGGKHIFRRPAHIRQAQKAIAEFAQSIKEDNCEIDNCLV